MNSQLMRIVRMIFEPLKTLLKLTFCCTIKIMRRKLVSTNLQKEALKNFPALCDCYSISAIFVKLPLWRFLWKPTGAHCMIKSIVKLVNWKDFWLLARNELSFFSQKDLPIPWNTIWQIRRHYYPVHWLTVLFPKVNCFWFCSQCVWWM